MADELSPLDYLLHRGEAYPATRSAFLNLEILDGPADWGRLREAMDRASRVIIRMRQKVVIPPLPATPPRWVVDPDFDLDYHLRRVALPAPGTLRQLLDFAELTLQSPLDTSRALWEAVYVEGLADGRSALLTKLSHAITDGLGGIALFEQVYDTERDPEPRPMPPVPVPRDVSGSDLLRDSIRQLPETTFTAGRKLLGRAAGTAARLITQPGATVTEAVGFADSARRVLSPPPAAPSPLLRRRSLVSRTIVLELPLADLRAAAKAVNTGARGGGAPATPPSTTRTWLRCAEGLAGITRCSACRSTPFRWPCRSACAVRTTRPRATGSPGSRSRRRSASPIRSSGCGRSASR